MYIYQLNKALPSFHQFLLLQLLRKSGGSLELVDVSNELPQLVRRPGLKKWKVGPYQLGIFLFY